MSQKGSQRHTMYISRWATFRRVHIGMCIHPDNTDVLSLFFIENDIPDIVPIACE